MSYATIGDVITRYKPIATMVGTGAFDVMSADVASVFIADAEALVNGWLARRYTTPLSLPSPLITQIASDLAIHAMLAEKLPSTPEFIDKRRERALMLLEQLADATISLGNSFELLSAGGDSYAWSNTMGQHPIFSPVIDELAQTPDADRVESDLTERDLDTGRLLCP